MTDDFGYLNARIRVRQSRMLPEAFLSEALTLDFSGLIKSLAESIYGPDLTGDDLADGGPGRPGPLTTHGGGPAWSGLGPGPGGRQPAPAAPYLANVKIILRGKKAGWTNEEILGRLGSGHPPRPCMASWLRPRTRQDWRNFLPCPGTPWPGPCGVPWPPPGSRWIWKLVLDREFYQAMLHRAQELDQPYLAAFLRGLGSMR